MMTRISSQASARRHASIIGRNDNKTRHRPHYRLLLATILIWLAGSGTSAFATNDPAASAASISGREAQLNGHPMPVGATLFPGDVVRLGQNSTAALRFQKSMVLAAPLTELVVESDGVALRNGRLQVRADGTEVFGVSGPFFRVKLAASPEGSPGSAEIRLAGMRAQVSAVAGAADLMAEGTAVPYRLNAGETATLDATGVDPAAQEASSPAAGQVSRLAPQVQIDRGQQHLVAAVSDRVYWNDDLRSGPTGRAHVTLNDGSQLNLGSDSSLIVVQHDAQAQQTSLDLLIGRIRGKITKLTQSSGKFEIHTPVGIAGLVGTDFSLFVTNDSTELMVFDGAVRFTPLNGPAITVNAGNVLRISRSGAVEGPAPASAQQVQTAENLTDVTSQAGQAGPAGQSGQAGQAPPVAAKRSIVPVVVTVTGVGAAIGIGVWQATRPAVSNSVP